MEFYLVPVAVTSEEGVTFPDTIKTNLKIDNGQTVEILARKESNGIEGSGTNTPVGIRRKYSFPLPDDAAGNLVVHLPGVSHTRYIITGVEPGTGGGEVAGDASFDFNALYSMYQPYLDNISAYEPMYFLVGANPEKSKFQLSFKYRFLNPDSPIAEKSPWLTGFHFGYTQTSFWDIHEESAPFSDTSYCPELFWLSKNVLDQSAGLLKGVFFQTGLQHHSNGRDGSESRSTNYLYLKPTFIFFDASSKFGVEISPKLWGYLDNDDATNPDIMDYHGYFEVEAKAGFADSIVFGSTLRFASEGLSYRLDLSYPLHRFVNNTFGLYFYAQYSDMLGESFLDYDERNRSLRLGLAIVR